MKGRKSVTGVTATLYGGPISWGSRKQKLVVTANTKAEYIIMALNCKQALWIAQILKDMGYSQYIREDGNYVDFKANFLGLGLYGVPTFWIEAYY